MSPGIAAHDEPTEQLGREELIRLVGKLRSTVARHEQIIARQAATIATLQARRTRWSEQPPGSESGGAPGRDSESGAKAVAERVPGFEYVIVFDGGAIGNPGLGYGSYQIVGADGVVAEPRLEFGDQVTNNQAEYRTLIRALEDMHERLGPDVSQTTLAVRGDSQLVINTVTGRWKVRHPDLQPLHRRAAELLGGFGRVDVAWHRRHASVRVLGH